MAIPAYQKYQASAKVSTIKGTINQIIKAYNACITVKAHTACDDAHIDMTLAAQPTVTITPTIGTGTPLGTCFVVAGVSGTSLAGYSACVGLTSEGAVLRQSTDANILATGTAATCMAASSACQN